MIKISPESMLKEEQAELSGSSQKKAQAPPPDLNCPYLAF